MIRRPLDPVSTLTWSMVWHVEVPGMQMVTLTNGTSTETVPGGPSSTMSGATLSPVSAPSGIASASPLEPPSPPVAPCFPPLPLPQASTTTRMATSHENRLPSSSQAPQSSETSGWTPAGTSDGTQARPVNVRP